MMRYVSQNLTIRARSRKLSRFLVQALSRSSDEVLRDELDHKSDAFLRDTPSLQNYVITHVTWRQKHGARAKQFLLIQSEKISGEGEQRINLSVEAGSMSWRCWWMMWRMELQSAFHPHWDAEAYPQGHQHDDEPHINLPVSLFLGSLDNLMTESYAKACFSMERDTARELDFTLKRLGDLIQVIREETCYAHRVRSPWLVGCCFERLADWVGAEKLSDRCCEFVWSEPTTSSKSSTISFEQEDAFRIGFKDMINLCYWRGAVGGGFTGAEESLSAAFVIAEVLIIVFAMEGGHLLAAFKFLPVVWLIFCIDAALVVIRSLRVLRPWARVRRRFYGNRSANANGFRDKIVMMSTIYVKSVARFAFSALVVIPPSLLNKTQAWKVYKVAGALVVRLLCHPQDGWY